MLDLLLALAALWAWSGLITLRLRDSRDKEPVEAAMLFGPVGLILVVWFWVMERRQQ